VLDKQKFTSMLISYSYRLWKHSMKTLWASTPAEQFTLNLC